MSDLLQKFGVKELRDFLYCTTLHSHIFMGASITDRTIFLTLIPKSFTFINVILNIHEYECLQAIWPTGDGERGTYRNQPWVTDDALAIDIFCLPLTQHSVTDLRKPHYRSHACHPILSSNGKLWLRHYENV